ncbi:MAG: hypothetical protein ACE5E6_01130 [Phycisphaerae bacterium]
MTRTATVTQTATACLVVFLMLPTGACVNLEPRAPDDASSGTGPVAPPPDTGNIPGPVLPGATGTPRVTLTVTNPTPNLLEEVQFLCVVEGGSAEGVTFAYQPDDARLVVDSATGVASIIVQESDLGVGVTFTCTGTNASGTGPPSLPQTVIPTPPPEPIDPVNPFPFP